MKDNGQIRSLLHKYGTYEKFNMNLMNGLIHKDSICFIEDTRQIYAQGRLYGMSKEEFDRFKNEVNLSLDDILKRIKSIEDSKGKPDGIATLNSSGVVPSSQLPSYVDDVLSYPTRENFPLYGEDGKIYVTEDTNLTYRWAGDSVGYVEISKSIGLGETSSTAFPGNRGKQLEETVTEHKNEIDNKIDGIDNKIDKVDNKIEEFNNKIEELEDTIENVSVDIQIDDELSETSENPVQNKVVTEAINVIINNFNEDDLSYGVYHDDNNSDPTCIRIGNMTMHKQLPIQSEMKGCILDDNGNVVRYLAPENWDSSINWWEPPIPLDGREGQVMVEIPEHYRKFNYNNNRLEVRISQTPIIGYHKVPKMYVSAYEASLQRSTNKLSSVVNTTEDYRGGDNTSDSLLGMPVTNLILDELRTYARNRNNGDTRWNCYTYEAHKTLYWLFVVEYATLNSNKEYTPALTPEGYRQGGLGNGVIFSSNFLPYIPCGYTNNLGNNTGVVKFNISEGDTVEVPRYRGIENPFGHIYKVTDGILINKVDMFVSDNPKDFSSESVNNYELIGTINSGQGYVKKIIGGKYGDIIVKEHGGSSNTYFCGIQSVLNAFLKCVFFGCNISSEINLSLISAEITSNMFINYERIGTRLCFHPEYITYK